MNQFQTLHAASVSPQPAVAQPVEDLQIWPGAEPPNCQVVHIMDDLTFGGSAPGHTPIPINIYPMNICPMNICPMNICPYYIS